MRNYRARLALIAAPLAFAVSSAFATDTHDYAKGEYAIIRDGLAPNKQISLAAHGDGEGASENFHIWLMAEPAHRKLAVLDDIGSDNNLDTGPDAYHATWAADSRHVAVNFRSDRHVMELNLYRVDSRRVRPVSGSTLFKEVTSRNVGADDHLGQSVTEIAWIGPNRFLLTENRQFLTADVDLARKLGVYGKVIDGLDDGRWLLEFSAEAEAVLIAGDRYRIVDLRAGKFSK